MSPTLESRIATYSLSQAPVQKEWQINSYRCTVVSAVLCLVMSNSLQPHGLQPARLLCLGKKTGVHSSHSFREPDPDPVVEPGFPALQAASL